ncbi:MAG: DUF1499 domain-containing protein [Siculibacillus sp.]|nr:DUF1499 domain-containing protein [Siculibacillus sp.]
MLHRPPETRSELATWSRRLGAFAVPVLVIVIIAHRSGLMPTVEALVVIAFAFGFAALALVLSLLAAALIWHDGRRGGRDAAIGALWAVVALSPAAYLGVEWMDFPKVTDVSTDVVDPPLHREAAFLRAGWLNSARPPNPEERARIRAAWPEIVTRRFSVGSDLLFLVTRRLVEEEGWKVTEMVQPNGDGERGRIEAVARTLIFGFEDDVVVRVLPEPSGSRIDLRSSIRWGTHDFGRNARRIRDFLDELDRRVVASYGR